MKDETFTFFEDMKEKSITARSAHKKPCRGPSAFKDSLTQKEWEKMNGPTSTYALGKTMSFKAFSAMPLDIQEKYLRNIIDTWGVGAYTIAPAMSCCGPLIAGKLKDFHILVPARSNKAQRDKFKAEFGGPFEVKPTDIAPVSVPQQMTMRSSNLSFSGAYDAEQLAASLKCLFPAGTQVAVTISIEVA